MFFAPDVHLRELKKAWTDELIIEGSFLQKLVGEWEEFVLYVSRTFCFLKLRKSTTLTPRNQQSTVMLTVNVAFLAIPGVIVVPPDDSKRWIKASPAQVASSMSLVFSIGGIIAGLVLIRRNRTMGTPDSRTAVRWSFLMLRTLLAANWLLGRLPAQHDLARLLPRTLGSLIQLDVCSADVVVSRLTPSFTVSR